MKDRRNKLVIKPCVCIVNIPWIKSQPLDQDFSFLRCLLGQFVQMRPACLWIDMVRSDRRNASPVIETSTNELLIGARTEIRWGLDIHLGTKQDACERDRPEQLIQIWFGGLSHTSVRL